GGGSSGQPEMLDDRIGCDVVVRTGLSLSANCPCDAAAVHVRRVDRDQGRLPAVELRPGLFLADDVRVHPGVYVGPADTLAVRRVRLRLGGGRVGGEGVCAAVQGVAEAVHDDLYGACQTPKGFAGVPGNLVVVVHPRGGGRHGHQVGCRAPDGPFQARVLCHRGRGGGLGRGGSDVVVPGDDTLPCVEPDPGERVVVVVVVGCECALGRLDAAAVIVLHEN